jgi:uncharacterized damage-inducible protein DinB
MFATVDIMTTNVEAWLRGPVPDVPPLLMPAAHALMHAEEDATRALEGLTTGQIWMRRSSAASVGYHVRHLVGATDRLCTYARGEVLSEAQQSTRRAESSTPAPLPDASALTQELRQAVAAALDQLRRTPSDTLLDERGVGRQGLPSNVIGLLFHAAEHAARHAGQALTTAMLLKEEGRGKE